MSSVMLFTLLSKWFRARVAVPTGAAIFPEEPLNGPRTFIERRYTDVRRFSRLPAGGHFAAMQLPKPFANDLLQFAQQILS